MHDEKAPQIAPDPKPTKSRPEPPPFRPNKDLIGYIENHLPERLPIKGKPPRFYLFCYRNRGACINHVAGVVTPDYAPRRARARPYPACHWAR